MPTPVGEVEPVDREEQHVGRDGSELTLGEVEHPGALVDEHQPESDQPEDRAVHEAQHDERAGPLIHTVPGDQPDGDQAAMMPVTIQVLISLQI